MSIIKEEAKKLIERLPEEAGWDDIMYEIYVRKKVERSLKAVEKGDIISH